MGAIAGDFAAMVAMSERPGKRPFVDFASVPGHQWAMHERLLNWVRASRDIPMSMRVTVSAGFELYRSSDARREHGAETLTVIDQRDAQKIQFGVKNLPEARHRPVIQWYYLKNGANPARQARDLALTLQELADHVREARELLICNRV